MPDDIKGNNLLPDIYALQQMKALQMANNPLKALVDARGMNCLLVQYVLYAHFALFGTVSSVLPWLRPPHLMPPPTSQSEDMAKFLRQNIHHSLLAAANKQSSAASSEVLPNFANTTNKDALLPHHHQAHLPSQQQASLTRSSTPNTNEPCSPPPTLMPPPFQLTSSESSRRVTANLLSTGRIPKSDPLEGRLQDMLHYNMERCAGKSKKLRNI